MFTVLKYWRESVLAVNFYPDFNLSLNPNDLEGDRNVHKHRIPQACLLIAVHYSQSPQKNAKCQWCISSTLGDCHYEHVYLVQSKGCCRGGVDWSANAVLPVLGFDFLF